MTTLTLAQDDARPASQAAPMLPVETHIVSAVRALEAAKQQCEQALFTLKYAPRNRDAAFAAIQAVTGSSLNALDAYSNYDAVRSCEGQA